MRTTLTPAGRPQQAGLVIPGEIRAARAVAVRGRPYRAAIAEVTATD